MVFWEIKSCPRCGGDMFSDEIDLAGWYYEIHCLQCGFFKELGKQQEPLNKQERDLSLAK